ncbi:MAG: TolC family protein, partial [Planctomycetota bacterium]
RGPLPPDDPAAHGSMYRPGPWDGYEWRKLGRAPSIENPDWLEPYGISASERFGGRVVAASYDGSDKPGQVYLDDPLGKRPPPWANPHAIATAADIAPEDLPPIDDLGLTGAVDLAQIHNRDYQTEIEDVDLTALALTFERFQFDVRYLGFGGEPETSATYQARPDAQDRLVTDKRFGVSQVLPTGGQWIVEFLNNTIYFVSAGPGVTSSSSALTFQLVQPLLFGAGRRVVLEGLTQAERDLLYAVRDLARFRKTFFVDVVATGPGGGFLGLLNQLQVIRNEVDNIRRIEEQLVTLREFASQQGTLTEPVDPPPRDLEIPNEFRGRLSYDPAVGQLAFKGDLTDDEAARLLGLSDDEAYVRAADALVKRLRTEVVTLDVAQLENSLASARQSLESSQAGFADALDSYKIFLGLPPDMPVTLDDGLLGDFELIDPRLTDLESTLSAFDLLELSDDELLETARRLPEIRDRIRTEGFDSVRADAGRTRVRVTDGSLDDAAAARLRRDLARDDAILESVAADFRDASDRLDRLTAAIDGPAAAAAVADLDLVIGGLRDGFRSVVRNLTVLQVNARVELIDLRPFGLSLEEVTAFALANRLDLMNARAEVTDARRTVEVAANALEAVVDVVATGTLNTEPGNRPLDFALDRSGVDVGVRFTAPLDQIAERNTYRAAQIEYQRARRDYMLAEDAVKFDVRQQWRQLQVLKANFEIARQAVRFAAVQLDQAIAEGEAPVGDGRRSGGSQGLNLLNAFDSVLGTQNSLIGIWTDYETNRLLIHQDMGIMQIDEQGLWEDPFYGSSPATEISAPPRLPPADPPPPSAGIEPSADAPVPFVADDAPDFDRTARSLDRTLPDRPGRAALDGAVPVLE